LRRDQDWAAVEPLLHSASESLDLASAAISRDPEAAQDDLLAARLMLATALLTGQARFASGGSD